MELLQILAGSRTTRNLVAAVEEAVRTGSARPGDRLPSVRALAAAAGVSPTTVAAAYADLRRRGVAVSLPKSAVRIADRPPVTAAHVARPAGPDVRFDCSTFRADPTLLPDLDEAMRAASYDGAPPASYGAAPVDPRLAAAASALVPNGVVHDVCLASGALDGVERALATVASPGDRVAVEDPGHANLLDLLRAAGLVPEPVAIDDQGMLPEALAAAIGHGARAVIVTRRAQDPFGAALTAARASALVEVLRDHPRVLVIEDDHIGDAGDAAASIAGTTERWVSVCSLAKAFGPDLRIALIAGDPATVSRLAGRHAVGPGWVSHLLQRTAAHLLADPASEQLQATARAAYNARRVALLGALAARGIAAHGASGLATWVPVADEATVCLRLRDEGILVNPGARYRLRSAPAIRIVTANLAERDAPDVAAAIARATAGVLSRRT
jgi:DNA-binding transcriptional MocR family regulator